MELLPEGCIAKIVSGTTPADACRISVVSKLFNSAAVSDAVWCRFLPSDVVSMISQSDSRSSLLANPPSKKALFLALSDHPIIIDQGQKCFQLDRKSGKKCYMLAARALSITWGETPEYWSWITLPESRFPEVAQLRNVCWLEIHGAISTLALSPNTNYAAYLVLKMVEAYGFENCPVELSVLDVFGGETITKIVCLDPSPERSENTRVVGLQRPNMRSDGWLEIEMGEFFNSGLEDEQVEMSVWEIRGGSWKRGLTIEGIEIRPKEDN